MYASHAPEVQPGLAWPELAWLLSLAACCPRQQFNSGHYTRMACDMNRSPWPVSAPDAWACSWGGTEESCSKVVG